MSRDFKPDMAEKSMQVRAGQCGVAGECFSVNGDAQAEASGQTHTSVYKSHRLLLFSCSVPLGFSVRGILQARKLEWVAISFSRAIFLTQAVSSALAGGFFTTDPPGKHPHTHTQTHTCLRGI